MHAQALQLCSYLEERSAEVRGRRVIELGAGTGVVGIFAARLGMLCLHCEGTLYKDETLLRLGRLLVAVVWYSCFLGKLCSGFHQRLCINCCCFSTVWKTDHCHLLIVSIVKTSWYRCLHHLNLHPSTNKIVLLNLVLSFINNTGVLLFSGAIVTLTDLPLTLPQLRANVSANMPSSGWPATLPTVLPLSWGQDHINFPSDWDLVLCADIVYLPETYSLLVKTLVHLCKNTTVVYLSSKMRKEHETPRFFEECLPSRFNVELVHRDDGQNINIYRASLRKDQWQHRQPVPGPGLVTAPVMTLLATFFKEMFYFQPITIWRWV